MRQNSEKHFGNVFVFKDEHGVILHKTEHTENNDGTTFKFTSHIHV